MPQSGSDRPPVFWADKNKAIWKEKPTTRSLGDEQDPPWNVNHLQVRPGSRSFKYECISKNNRLFNWYTLLKVGFFLVNVVFFGNRSRLHLGSRHTPSISLVPKFSHRRHGTSPTTRAHSAFSSGLLFKPCLEFFDQKKKAREARLVSHKKIFLKHGLKKTLQKGSPFFLWKSLDPLKHVRCQGVI